MSEKDNTLKDNILEGARDIVLTGAKEIRLIVTLLAGVLILIVFTFLAPVYVMPDDSVERHWVWNAPTIPADRQYDRLTPEQKKLFESSPIRAKVLKSLENQPTSYPVEPVYLGPIFGKGFNVLGYLAMLATLAWLVYTGLKVYVLVKEEIEKQQKQAHPKKSLVIKVRRVKQKRV